MAAVSSGRRSSGAQPGAAGAGIGARSRRRPGAGAARCSSAKRGGARGPAGRAGRGATAPGARPAASAMKRLTSRSSQRMERHHHQPPARRQQRGRLRRARARSRPARRSPGCAAPGSCASPGRCRSGPCGTTRRMIAASCRGGGDRRLGARAATMARAMRRDSRSSPKLIERVGQLRLGQRVAPGRPRSGRSRSMRMSSGPSARKLKPRAGSSIWNEDTPRSSTTPSSACTPRAASSASMSPKPPCSRCSRPGKRAARAAPRAIASGSRSIAQRCRPPPPGSPRCSRRRRTCRRA